MNHKRAYLGMIGLLILCALALVGGAYEVQSIVGTKSQKLVSLKAKVQGLELQQTSLLKAQKNIASYTSLYNISKVVVPENKDQAETVRQIVNLASASQIRLGSVNFPSSTLGNVATGTATSGTSTTTISPSAIANSPSTKLSQLTPVKSIPGVYTLTITVTSDSLSPVSFSQLIGFLSALEQNRLTAQVNSVSISPVGTSTDSFNFTLNLSSYIKP